MDISAKEITFDKDGICNFCYSYQTQEKARRLEKSNFPWIVHKIKKSGKGKNYDCLIGLSGGVDSSLALHYAIENGLRPLCFSVDNGWNNPKADENIMKMVEKLKVPFYRYVIDLKKFNELQLAFIKGGVKNLEATTDHVLFATTYEMAVTNNIQYVITGGNITTESIMPRSWGEDPRDLYWIKSVYKSITRKRLTGLPVISLFKEQYYRLFKKIKFVPILDYYEYNRERAKEILEKEYGWIDYGEKHCESYFTWWFQGYYLYTKFGIDKRKAHYSSLINSGQMSKEEANTFLLSPPEYPKLGLEEKVRKYPIKSYEEYPNSESIRLLVSKCYAYSKRLFNFG
jgi:N-acetyl sugar amidotransferase